MSNNLVIVITQELLVVVCYMAWMFDPHQILRNAELFSFIFFLIFEQDFGFREIFYSLSSSIVKRKLAEISFVTMSRSIKCKMKYYYIGVGNLCEGKQRRPGISQTEDTGRRETSLAVQE